MPSAHDVLTIADPSALKDTPFDGADQRFCQLTDAANQALASEDEDLASRLYEQALAEAERLFDAAQVGGSPLIAPMAYTIACHNVAEVAKRAGDHTTAFRHKRHAVRKLVETAESRLDPLGLRLNCIRHLRHALAFLAEDLTEEDAERQAELDGLIQRYRAIGDELARVAAHVVSQEDRVETGNDPASLRGRLN